MNETWGVVVVAVVGIFATIVAPIWHERRRWQHEERLAFRQSRASAYSDFMIATERSVTIARSFASLQGLAWMALKEPRRHAMSTATALQASGSELIAALARVRLFGSAAVVARAEALLSVVARAGELVEARDDDEATWSPLIEDMKLQREAFVAATRAEIEPPE